MICGAGAVIVTGGGGDASGFSHPSPPTIPPTISAMAPTEIAVHCTFQAHRSFLVGSSARRDSKRDSISTKWASIRPKRTSERASISTKRESIWPKRESIWPKRESIWPKRASRRAMNSEKRLSSRAKPVSMSARRVAKRASLRASAASNRASISLREGASVMASEWGFGPERSMAGWEPPSSFRWSPSTRLSRERTRDRWVRRRY